MFSAAGHEAVGYVLMGYPRLPETFIASELDRVDRAGVRVRLFVLGVGRLVAEKGFDGDVLARRLADRFPEAPA
jgi:hypothetical protein